MKRNMALAAVPLIILGSISLLDAVTFTVAKDGTGQFTTIMAAINKANPGDIVQILDNAVYPEQVTINASKNGLTLTSKNPTSPNKPTIKWQDTVNTHPHTFAEAQDSNTINFDQNGALRCIRSSNIRIIGIAVDGGGCFPFGYKEVWQDKGGQRWPMQHGNAAIALYISGDVIIRDCDLSNAYFGIAVKDRNEGGIFGNANPADIQPWNVVPLSGFGRTGNHLVEYNRIHNNSYGMFFESVWDLGSTIRYNLFYECHHANDALASKIKGLTSEGQQQPGAAFEFKDHLLSPLAIYNNTFWHNMLIFCGNWRAGAQHLIFNNIYGEPFRYWQSDATFGSATWLELSPSFKNRMYNCVYASQGQKPTAYSVQIMNGFQVQGNGPIPQGHLVTAPFAAAANIRWVETPFLSTDPASPNFLTPDWADTAVQAYIKDQGWQPSGVKDQDGSWADLGAIPAPPGGRPVDIVTIKPTMPVFINGATANVNFDVTQRVGSMTGPSFTLFRFVGNIPFTANAFGGNATVIADIRTLPPPATPALRVGPNSYDITLSGGAVGTYAFFELIAAGTGSNSKGYTSAVGFLPYRQLDYKFVIDVFDTTDVDLAKPLSSVRAGNSYFLRIRAFKVAPTQPFTNEVNPAEVRLQSGFTLFSTATPPPVALTLPKGVPATGSVSQVMFTRVPAGNYDYVLASGKWNNGTNDLPFLGASNALRILPGPPAAVVFQDPPSAHFGAAPVTIDPGLRDSGTLYVTDQFGNRVDQAVTVDLASLNPTVGDFVGGAHQITTDSLGVGHFEIRVTNGKENQIFQIQAKLPSTATDTANAIVGKARDRMWIFFNDTLAYNPNDSLVGQVGNKLKVVIMVGKSARLDSLTNIPFSFSIDGQTPGLEFYASPDPAAVPATSFMLKNGRATLWVSSKVQIDNGLFAVRPDSLNTVIGSDPRSRIIFHKPRIAIDSAFYYADNGFGAVDRVEIFLRDTLSFPPDSLVLYWNSRAAGRLVVPAGPMMALSADKRHLTVHLSTPFTWPGSTAAANKTDLLGVCWNRPNTAPTAPADPTDFKITERVGPLLMSAQVVQRFDTGTKDILSITFSEPIVSTSLKGATLRLIKNGVETDLTVDSIIVNTATTFRVVVSGTAAPSVNDSLRIKGGGPLTDSSDSKNVANLNNRPVLITLKRMPVPVATAGYYDLNADGFVDALSLRFKAGVVLADCILPLDWGGKNKIDSIPVSRLVYAGDGSDNSAVMANVTGLFPGITTPKTSGKMFITPRYRSLPGDTAASAEIADNAAPVIVSAAYHPGNLINEKDYAKDTLEIVFSEPASIPAKSTTPFNLYSVRLTKLYTLSLNVGGFAAPLASGRLVVLDSAIVNNNDSIWIDPLDGIADAGKVVQANPNNRRVLLAVGPRAYNPGMKLSTNPFTPGITDINVSILPGVSGKGIAIICAPDNKSAIGKIYDNLGNVVADNLVFQMNMSSNPNRLYHVWDGKSRNNRLVGTNTYLAVVMVTDNAGNVHKEIIQIGVKR